MSTIQTNAIVDASGGNTATVNGQNITSSNTMGRNLITNGGFYVWQRATTRAFGGGYTGADRFAKGQYQEAGHERVSVTDVNVPSKFAAKVTSSSTSEASSGTRIAIGQMVESVDSEIYAGKTVTLSFWIKFSAASLTGTTSGFSYQLSEYDTSADPAFGTTGATRTNQTFISNGSYPTTWTKYTKTITCGASMKNLGARFLFLELVNTSNNSDFSYEITGIQIELGSIATDFEHRSYAEELSSCQRYYTQFDGRAAGAKFASGFAASTTTAMIDLGIPVTMRATPTVTITNCEIWDSAASYTPSSPVATGGPYPASQGIQLTSSGMTAYRPCSIRQSAAGVTITLSSEL